MRMPSKFVFALASLTFAFIPARAARLLVLSAAVLGAAGFYWIHVAPDMVVGIVDAVRPPNRLDAWLMAVTPPFSDQIGVAIPPGLADGPPAAPRDFVIAFGEPLQARGAAPSGLLRVDRIGVLPLSDVLAFIEAPGNLDWISNPNRWGVIVLAALIALFARALLRVGAGAALAAGFTVLSFIALHLNAREGFLPMPEPFFPGLILAGGIIGAVVGYKASLEDRTRLGERLAAVLLAVPLQMIAATSGYVPGSVSYATYAVALLTPTVVPVAYAALLLAWGLQLGPLEGIGALTGMLAVRFLFHGDAARPLPAALEPRVMPRTDERGRFDLDDFINEKEA